MSDIHHPDEKPGAALAAAIAAAENAHETAVPAAEAAVEDPAVHHPEPEAPAPAPPLETIAANAENANKANPLRPAAGQTTPAAGYTQYVHPTRDTSADPQTYKPAQYKPLQWPTGK